jgi:hypothetical protein
MEYLMEKSNVCSNRLVINEEGEYVPVRYLEDTRAELYKDWCGNKAPHQLGSKVPCKTTFYNYVKKARIFKNPFRWTDMCEYCEKLRDLKKTLPNDLLELGYQQANDNGFIDLKQANNFLQKKRAELIEHSDEVLR